MRSKMCLSWIVLLGACSKSPPTERAPAAPAPSAPPPAPAVMVPAPSPVVPALPPAPALLLSATGDVDGVAGAETITLHADGTLTAGSASLVVPLDVSHEAFSKQRQLSAIALGGKRRGVLLAMPTEETEDPPTRYRVYLYDGGTLRNVFDQALGVYGVTPMTFSAAGVASYVEDGWTACERMKHPRKAAQHRVSLALDKAGTAIVETGRKPSGETQTCDQLSACPYVYVLGGTEPQLAGEVLRNVRGAAAATLQSLPLGGSGAGVLAIRIAEEKPEVTFLDEVYVEVDGVPVWPRTCAATPAPAYCVADGVPHILREGDRLDLELDVPAHEQRALFARGYYIPTPTAKTR